MKKPFASRGAAAASASVLTLLIAGGGYAIAAGGGTIHACAKKSNGALRVAKRCRKSEHTLTWNAQGPAGPRGAQGTQGAAGPRGAQGPQGPSAAYSTGSDSVTTTSGSTPVTITSLTLPAGKYVLAASIRAADVNSTTGAGPFCSLEQHSNSTALVTAGARIQPDTANSAFETTLSPVATVVLTSPDAIDLVCQNEDATAAIDFLGSRLTAISVATVNGS
jgi:hypothetical protein